ncbi:hypothetical protein [Geotalea toluenoxydans]|uniref:hypothetical protein n=1 Tax=Geotalea toluenoxydans TaxID=421624 RepID=UPI000A4430D5|nr:hypothetical protein [Geotalea toluenoxydans]
MKAMTIGTKGEMTMKMIRQNLNNDHLSLKRAWCLAVAIVGLLFASVISVQAADLLHNSADTASTKWQAEGGWGVAGGKYGKFDCAPATSLMLTT